ncbi:MULTISPECIES: ParA family protein [Holzapfeliella]|uniref:ParA family protein n=1 Tax=Holzapfeliella saturejae TaxID=3082953 RepID=A0ABU8SHI8_9LACO
MKIISFAAVKGGVGKTTLTFNFAEYLIGQGKKVLLVDSDHQGSLSHIYDALTEKDTLYDVFTGQNIALHQVNEQLSILPSSPELDRLEATLATRNNQNLLFMMWLQDNVEQIQDFDYILIDCHPDFMTITKNMIAVSHYVISPLEPSEFGFMNLGIFNARMEELKQETIDIRTRESYIDAKTLYVPNMIKHNTKSSREFLDSVSQFDNVATDLSVPYREVFNKSTLENKSVFTLLEEQNNQSAHTLHKQLDDIFSHLTERISQ